MNAVFPALFAVVTLASTSCQKKEQAAAPVAPSLSVSAIAIDEEKSSLKGDVQFRGRITKVLNGVRHTFDLVLDRLSVTPGQCRAP